MRAKNIIEHRMCYFVGSKIDKQAAGNTFKLPLAIRLNVSQSNFIETNCNKQELNTEQK